MHWYSQPPGGYNPHQQQPAASYASQKAETQSAKADTESEPADNCTIFASTAFEVCSDSEGDLAVVESDSDISVFVDEHESHILCDQKQSTVKLIDSFEPQNNVPVPSEVISLAESQSNVSVSRDVNLADAAVSLSSTVDKPTVMFNEVELGKSQASIPIHKQGSGSSTPLRNVGIQPTRARVCNDACNKPPDVRCRKLPVSAMICGLLLCLLSLVTECNSQAPMICRTGHTIAKFRLPLLPPCILPDISESHKPYSLTFTLHKPNLIQYKTKAYHCKVIETKIVTHSGFFGEGQTRTDNYIDKLVSKDECYSMIKWHTSQHGDLTLTGSIYKTNNVAKPEYHTGFHCCKDYNFNVINAYLYETLIFKRHGDKEKVESPVGVVGHCTYSSGFCNLKDGSALLWKPDAKEECQYLPHQTFSGNFQSKFWTSDSGELALSFTKTVIISQSKECGGDVQISDQGIAVNRVINVTQSRGKRQSHSVDGVVTDSEVNAKLQALELRISENYNHMFRAAFRDNCRVMQSISQLIIASLERNPTLAARHLLNHTNIHAKLTHNLLSVYPCEVRESFSVVSTVM